MVSIVYDVVFKNLLDEKDENVITNLLQNWRDEFPEDYVKAILDYVFIDHQQLYIASPYNESVKLFSILSQKLDNADFYIVEQNPKNRTNSPQVLDRLFVAAATYRTPAPLLSKPATPDPWEQFVDTCGLRAEIDKLCKSTLLTLSRNEALGTHTPIAAHNFVIRGPQGTGKTTAARITANHLMFRGIIARNAPIVFVQAAELVAGFIGQSSKNTIKQLNEAKRGVLIIDEADTFLDQDDFGLNVLNALNTYTGNSPNKPVIILTCYEGRYEALMKANIGLSGRFRVLTTTHLDDKTLRDILEKQFAAADMICADGVLDLAHELLLEVKRAKGLVFANGRDVATVVSAIIAEQSERLEKEGVSISTTTDISENLRRRLLTIKPMDVPTYDDRNLCFIVKPPERTATMSARVTDQRKVVELTPKPRR